MCQSAEPGRIPFRLQAIPFNRFLENPRLPTPLLHQRRQRRPYNLVAIHLKKSRNAARVSLRPKPSVPSTV